MSPTWRKCIKKHNIFCSLVVTTCIFFPLFAFLFLYAKETTVKQRGLPVLEIPQTNMAPVFETGSLSTFEMGTPVYNQQTAPLSDVEKWFRRTNRLKRTQIPLHTKHPFYRKLVISNENTCGKRVDIFIYVQSAANNFNRRASIRETWGNREMFVNITLRTIFFLGKSTSPKLQAQISAENLAYHDIVQGDFVDDVRNLTLKSILALRWIYQFCPQARYILKTDDDMFVNTVLLVERIVAKIWSIDEVIFCHHKRKGTSPIIRNPNSKWYVPKDIMKGLMHFPMDFCSGYAVLFSADLVPVMYQKSFSIPFMLVDDVYMFGLLLENSNVTFINALQNFTLNQNLALKQYESKTSNISYVAASSWTDGNMRKFWFSALNKHSQWADQHTHVIRLHKRNLAKNVIP